MEELWVEDKNLVSEETWIKEINNLKTNTIIDNKKTAMLELKKRLYSAIQMRPPQDKFGIFFSGGVDSSFIAAVCKESGANFVCYTVGFQDEETKDPEDVIEAQKVAKELGLNLKYKIFNLEETEEIIKKTVKILKPVGKTDVVNVGVGMVVLAAAELAKEEGVNYFLSGLGSEEIFAGYERHDKSTNVNEECWTGLKQMWSRDLVRDFNISKALDITVKTPFLDQDLIKYAMQLPGEWKIVNEKKKVILREVAEKLLKDFAWRKKKAAQYGSCFDKAISKIAKKNGFKLKKDWLDSL